MSTADAILMTHRDQRNKQESQNFPGESEMKLNHLCLL